MSIEQSFEDNSKKKENEQKGPELQIKGETSPEETKTLHDLSEKTGVPTEEYLNLYALYKQAKIAENIEEFENLASAPGFDWVRNKIKEIDSLPEILEFLGSKSASEIKKEEDNFKNLMGEENNK